MGNSSSLDSKSDLLYLETKAPDYPQLGPRPAKKICSKTQAVCYESRTGPEATSYINFWRKHMQCSHSNLRKS